MGRKRIYTVDENYFKNPNIENCYYAGFIAADGYISKPFNNTQAKLKIKISEKDACFLDTFLERLNSNYPIKRRLHKISKPSVEIGISSNKICDDLKSNFNIVTNKTFLLLPPNLDDFELIKSFICGVIDGDGCINIGKDINGRPRLQLQITGASKPFMCWLKVNLEKMLLKQSKSRILEYNNYYEVKYSCKMAQKILGDLSKVDVLKLDRKWSKIKTFERIINEDKWLRNKG